MGLFSVIIPTYNRAALLREALDSVLSQTFTDYEIIVVDDGSTDDTAEQAATYGDKVLFLRQSNCGPGAARNLGARHARGEYLAFLDSDDLWFPWTLECYQQVIQRHDRPAFVAGKPHRFKSAAEKSSASFKELRTLAFPDYLASCSQWRWWGASSFVIRHDAFEKAGGFANEWINGEDADMALRLGEARGFVQVTEPCTFGYREHDVSAMKNWDRTLAGIRHAIRSENQCQYPGGPSRALERWEILTRQTRPFVLGCLQHGMRKEAWQLYFNTLRWNRKLNRWKYLVGFPVKAILTR